MVNHNNFQNIFLSFKNVGFDFFFLLVHLIAFLEASWMIYLNSCRYGSCHFGCLGTLRVKVYTSEHVSGSLFPANIVL